MTSPLALRWALPSVRRLRTLTFFAELRSCQCAASPRPLCESSALPVEILAFDFDIAHAIARLPLPLLAVGLFLPGTHDCCVQ